MLSILLVGKTTVNVRMLLCFKKNPEIQKGTLCLCVVFRGSAIAKIIGNNVRSSKMFEKTVNMYVYEEIVEGKKLTDIINTTHENVKYLPGIKIPSNVVRIYAAVGVFLPTSGFFSAFLL